MDSTTKIYLFWRHFEYTNNAYIITWSPRCLSQSERSIFWRHAHELAYFQIILKEKNFYKIYIFQLQFKFFVTKCLFL